LYGDLSPPPQGVPMLFYRLCAWNIEHRGGINSRIPDLSLLPEGVPILFYGENHEETKNEWNSDLPLDISWNYY
jgi:hypothetical protein